MHKGPNYVMSGVFYVLLVFLISPLAGQEWECHEDNLVQFLDVTRPSSTIVRSFAQQIGSNTLDTDWNIHLVDSVDFKLNTKMRLALDSQDNPHLVYITFPDDTGWLTYAVWDPQTSSFQIARVGSESYDPSVDIALDQNDLPHFSYHNHQRQGDQDNVVHYFNDGTNWIDENIFSPGHDGWSSSIAIDSQNRPRITYIDPDCCDGDSGGVEYAFYDGSDWTIESTGGESNLWIFHGTSLAIDSQDISHVSRYDDVAQDLILASRSSGTWSNQAVDTTGDVGRYSSLFIDANDLYHIGYYEHIADSSGIIKYAYFNGSSWEISSVDTLHRFYTTPEDNNRIPDMVSVAVNSLGTPYLAYADEKQVKVARFNGTSWEREVIEDVTSTNLSIKQEAAMKLDSQGLPHVAFAEVGAGATGTATLNFGLLAVKKPVAFKLDVVPSAGFPVHPGDTLELKYTYLNYSTAQLGANIWVQMLRPNGGIRNLLNGRPVSLGPEAVINRSRNFFLAPNAALGTYTFVARIGLSLTDTVSTDTVVIQVVPEVNASPDQLAIETVPEKTTLDKNYPNPFNPETVIRYQLADAADVRLMIYDVLGREVRQLAAGARHDVGFYSKVWDGTNDAGQQVGSGIYFYQLTTSNGFTQTRKMLLTR